MAQKPEYLLPYYLNLDTAFEKLSPNESPFIKGIEAGINSNPDTGANNPTLEGQNVLDLTPTRSNIPVPGVLLPKGYNKNAGSFYSETTREEYHFNHNDNGLHGIYVINGDSGVWVKVIEDSNFPFTDDQEAFLKDHRVSLRFVLDKYKNILEKFLVWTNGAGWQGWIPVNAAIKTNGFDASLFPYYTLQQPHYDRRELIEWPVRPPMMNPIVSPIANTPSDAGTVNRVIDQGFQFALRFNNTDGRPSTFSPYSLPLIIKSEDFLNDPDILPKKALLTLPAGSPLTESIDVMVRFTAKIQAGIPSTVAWGDWQKYERIYKFSGSTGSPSDVLSTAYWTRTNPWAKYSYDPIQNTIQYVFDNSRLGDLVDPVDAKMLQNDIPLRSIALTDMGDTAALSDNLYGYNNFPFGTINNLDITVKEKANVNCAIPTRKMRTYLYCGRTDDAFSFTSQVGYYVGNDTQVRFGSLSASAPGGNGLAQFNVLQSKEFGLDFADHSAFVCYLKGTPYYAVGNWYQVNRDNTYVKLDSLLDFGNNDVLTYVQNVFIGGGYFMCVFDFEVPAGRYDACIGRHNVALNADFRNTSTYVAGIANSRSNFPNVFMDPNHNLVSDSKEMELDCTNGDLDVWGNGHDMFYVFCPSPTQQGNKKFRFIEGYFKEAPDVQIGVELFPYDLNILADFSGEQTDKNGFYWAYTKRQNSGTANITISCRLNCKYPVGFTIPTSGFGLGWMVNGNSYLKDHNNGVVGDCNRVIINGKITDPSGVTPFSNISVSIADGGTVLTKTDGTFELIVHNGQQNPRVSNIYINSSGNFLITVANCGILPLYNYNEAFAPCFNCNVRTYPFPIIAGILIQGGTQESLKQGASYITGFACADLAGRLSFVNIIKQISVPSFLQRNDTLATFFQLLIKGILGFEKDLAWFAPYVSGQVKVRRWFEWVGDSIKFIDNAGNVTVDPDTAVFCSIAIDSFYNYALAKNFSILASYQFSPDDRIKIMDDGNGNLLNTGAFGEQIDLPVLGTNYNQAAQAAQIVPNSSTVPIVNVPINNTVNNTVNTSGTPATTQSFETQKNNVSITLYVKYDQRLKNLINSTGFWIEIYTPDQQPQEIPFNELTWYPVINGEVAIFKGVVNGKPVFNFPTSIDLPFWDTYLFFRNINIPNVGDKFLNHPFESPNISDSFGANVSSGGRKWEKNDDARQQWVEADVIRSDAFVGNGIINGLGMFRSSNRKNFVQYPFGAILATITQRSIVLFICENDWFTTTFDFHFTYPNEQGIMVVNLDNNLSTPHQKTGDNFGLHPEDTGAVLVHDKFVWWYDRKNYGFVICNYRSAKDVTDIEEEVEGGKRKIGVKSYFIKKTLFITGWNNSHDNTERFDVIAGINEVKNNIHITFRPRRKNSNDPRSYVNQRRNWDMSKNETIVYNIDNGRWTRAAAFTPEGYGNIKGNAQGMEFITYAAGKPYYHNNTGDDDSFLNFYGIQTEPVLTAVFNKPVNITNILQALSLDSTLIFYVDLIYTSMFNSFSYIPTNYFRLKEAIYYSTVLRDMVSYPPISKDELFRSMLHDGQRIYDVFFMVRFVQDPNTIGQYFQINNIFCLLIDTKPIKK